MLSHRTRFGTFSRVALVATLVASPTVLASPIMPPISEEPPTVEPATTDRELFCKLLKALGQPCPPEEPGDFTLYEDYYADIERAWMSCDPNSFDPQRREDTLAAALTVKSSQTPAPAGVDPAAHQNFILVLDEIIYEMGG